MIRTGSDERFFIVFYMGYEDDIEVIGDLNVITNGDRFVNREQLVRKLLIDNIDDVIITGVKELSYNEYNDWIEI